MSVLAALPPQSLVSTLARVVYSTCHHPIPGLEEILGAKREELDVSRMVILRQTAPRRMELGSGW